MLNLPKNLIDQIIKDQKVRIAVAHESHSAFFAIYLAHYLKFPSAPFHEELFAISENEEIKNAVIVAFRGSAKSTLMTLSYPLWAVTGKQQKKFVLILAHTMYQAKMYMKNIREELENNEILRADLGPFKEEDEWHAYSIVIPKYNTRITCASYEQGVRGLRHRQHRPDLIVCDDVEDLESVKTLEGRDKVYNWLTGEVIPAGDRNTRLIVIGNLLHEDSLIMRLKKSISDKNLHGVFRAYPFLNDERMPTWPGKFAGLDDIEAERIKTGSEVAWQREYLLRIVPDEDRLVDPKWIKFYDELPNEKGNNFRFNITGIDLAISKNEKADYTSMVSAKIYGNKEND